LATTYPDCLFCKITAGTIPSRKAYEDEAYFAFHDIGPQSPTHVLIVPKRHIATLNDLTSADTPLVGGMVDLARRLAEQLGIAESGYRLVFNCNADGGQTVGHIHLHLLGGRAMRWPPG